MTAVALTCSRSGGVPSSTRSVNQRSSEVIGEVIREVTPAAGLVVYHPRRGPRGRTGGHFAR
jgi:hypothetical protein